jgi:photosystem II stability/assembly factor-like uncharacterized protein
MQVSSGTNGDLYGIWGSASNDFYIVGETLGGGSGLILHGSSDSWAQSTSSFPLFGVSGKGSAEAFAVGSLGMEASVTQWNGTGWADRGVVGGGTLQGAWVDMSGSEVYVVGSNGSQGTILHSINGGATWTTATRTDTSALLSVWGSSVDDVYTVGNGTAILHSTDRGSTWTRTTGLTLSIALRGVWGSSADDVYAVGGTGGSSAVLHTTNRGTSWTVTPAGTFGGGFNLNDISGTSASDVYVVGPDGRIFHSTGADVWTAENSPTTQELLGVWGIPGGDVYAVGRSGTILHKASGR